MTDPLDEMIEALSAQAWVAKQPGDFLKGSVVHTGTRETDFGTAVPMVVVKVEQGLEDGQPVPPGERRAITGFQQVLAKHMRQQLDRGMGYGWRCKALFLGERQGSRQTYADWGFVAEAAGAPSVRPQVQFQDHVPSRQPSPGYASGGFDPDEEPF